MLAGFHSDNFLTPLFHELYNVCLFIIQFVKHSVVFLVDHFHWLFVDAILWRWFSLLFIHCHPCIGIYIISFYLAFDIFTILISLLLALLVLLHCCWIHIVPGIFILQPTLLFDIQCIVNSLSWHVELFSVCFDHFFICVEFRFEWNVICLVPVFVSPRKIKYQSVVMMFFSVSLSPYLHRTDVFWGLLVVFVDYSLTYMQLLHVLYLVLQCILILMTAWPNTLVSENVYLRHSSQVHMNYY